MLPSSAFQSLERLTAFLPFHIDDSDKVNHSFSQWCTGKSSRDLEIVDLWTYCFTRRYFLIKFVKDPAYHVADFDVLIEEVFKRVERRRADLNADARYASWVSVICKNVYRNYLSRRRRLLSLEDPVQSAARAELREEPHDMGHAYVEAIAAINRLPSSLRDIARMRLIENYSYKEIGAITGRPLPTLRAYVNKALKRLRKDRRLLAFVRPDDELL